MKKTKKNLKKTTSSRHMCKMSLVSLLFLALCTTFSANAQWVSSGYILESKNNLVEIGKNKPDNVVLRVHGGAQFQSGATFVSSLAYLANGFSIRSKDPFLNVATVKTENLAIGGNLIPGTVLTVDGRTYISEADGKEKSFSSVDNDRYKDYLLWVEKGIVSKDFANYDIKDWPDYVFKSEYQLPSLYDVEKSIKENGHLPNMPSAESIEKDGFIVSDMTKRVVKTIEERILHSIDQKKKIDAQKEQLTAQQELINNLITRLKKLEILENQSK